MTSVALIEEPRMCSRCEQLKTEFRSKNVCMDCKRRLSNESKKRTYNKELNTSRCRDWRRANPSYDRERRRRVGYGVTPERYAELLQQQEGRCAICRTDTPGGHGQFHVDHDHETGKVRGLLCTNCNPGLGQFKDDPRAVGASSQLSSSSARESQ